MTEQELKLQELIVLNTMGMVPIGSVAYVIMNQFMHKPQTQTAWSQ